MPKIDGAERFPGKAYLGRIEGLIERQADVFGRLMKRHEAAMQRHAERFEHNMQAHDRAMQRLAASFERRIQKLSGAPGGRDGHRWQDRTRRPRRPPRFEAGMIPAIPDKPLNLSGGAAAPLEFDE